MMAWVLSFLAPPIVLAAATHFGSSQKVGNFMTSYYAPYEWLAAREPLKKPLLIYLGYWMKKFGYEGTVTSAP